MVQFITIMKSLSILCAVLVSVLFVGCNDPVIPEPYIEIKGGNSYTYDYQSRTHSIDYYIHNVTEHGKLTNVTSNCGWIEVIDHYNYEIKFTIDENTSGATRSGKIILTRGTAIAEINITQRSFTIDDINVVDDAKVSAYGACNAYVEYSIADDSAEECLAAESLTPWIHIIDASKYGHIYLDIEPNITTKTRVGEIKVSIKGLSKKINIEQDPAYQVIKVEYFAYVNSGNLYEFYAAPEGFYYDSSNDVYSLYPDVKYHYVSLKSSTSSLNKFYWWSGDKGELDAVFECGYYKFNSYGDVKSKFSSNKGVFYYAKSSSVTALAYGGEKGVVVVYYE